jgi:tight adherence protein B
MGNWTITILSSLCFFLSIYLGWDFLIQKIWNPMLVIRDQTHQLYQDMFMDKSKEEVLRQQLLVSGSVAALFFFVFWPNIFVGFPMAVMMFWATWRLPLFYIKKFTKPARTKAFTLQLIDGLTLMANAMKSGLNVPQAMQIVVSEMPSPIRDEFGLVLSENKVGLTLEKAFENLAKRVDTEDVTMFVTSVNILRETGGNVAETFQTIVLTIRERVKLQGKIAAMTSQGKASAVIVGGMPFVLAGVMYAIDPVMMKPLFTHPIGWAIWVGVCILVGLGVFLILKVTTIRV